MPKVIVNHSGNCAGHFFKAGEPIELPQHVVDALGDSATLVEKSKSQEKREEVTKVPYAQLQAQAKELGLPVNVKYDDLKASIDAKLAATGDNEQKDAHAPANKMVTSGEVVTK